jgi:lipopolysaccharide transport system permease protein
LVWGIKDDRLYLRLEPELLIAAGGLVLCVALALSIGLFTSIYGAQARDVRFTLSYLLGLWYLVTPVLYPLSAMHGTYREVAELNPMTAPVQMVKYGALGIGEVPLESLAVSLGLLLVLSTLGLWFFAKSESAAVDSL